MPNFIKIGQSVVKISWLLYFSVILNSFEVYLKRPKKVLGGPYHCAKFGCDRCSSFDNMKVSIFCTFRFYMPIHTPKIGLGHLTP